MNTGVVSYAQAASGATKAMPADNQVTASPLWSLIVEGTTQPRDSTSDVEQSPEQKQSPANKRRKTLGLRRARNVRVTSSSVCNSVAWNGAVLLLRFNILERTPLGQTCIAVMMPEH